MSMSTFLYKFMVVPSVVKQMVVQMTHLIKKIVHFGKILGWLFCYSNDTIKQIFL